MNGHKVDRIFINYYEAFSYECLVREVFCSNYSTIITPISLTNPNKLKKE